MEMIDFNFISFVKIAPDKNLFDVKMRNAEIEMKLADAEECGVRN